MFKTYIIVVCLDIAKKQTYNCISLAKEGVFNGH